MAPFRPRALMPEHYDQKMIFWKEMILSYCGKNLNITNDSANNYVIFLAYKGSACISINELKSVFIRNGTAPYCLQEVLRDMAAEGNLTTKDELMQASKSTAGWVVDSLIFKPLGWGFGKLKEMVLGVTDDEVYVVQTALQNLAIKLQNHVQDRHSFNNIISEDDLMNEEIPGVSQEGICLVLQHLIIHKKAVYIEQLNNSSHHQKLIKFSGPHKTAAPITEIERSVYNLEQTEKFLHEEINKKEELVTKMLINVKAALKDGRKQLAKTYLRKKHMMEADLLKTVNILDSVQTMLQRIHAAKSDKVILNTYKAGSEAIRKAFAESGIDLDNVEDVIEGMKEIYANQDEVESAISAPLRGTKDVDDSELEQELLDLISSNEVAKKDLNENNAGGGMQSIDDMTAFDQELEMRLQRLRSDFTYADEQKTQTKGTRVTDKTQ